MQGELFFFTKASHHVPSLCHSIIQNFFTRFHQCCLVWQHPSLPWLELFPRSAGKVSASLGSNSAIANNQLIRDALYREWCDSFRSLFHLLRARQCPYFYVCTNNFTVLFRAAGICGLSEMHALLTPTTRGFRQALKQEGIQIYKHNLHLDIIESFMRDNRF